MANLAPYSAFIRLLFEAVESASAIQQRGIPAKLGFAPPDEPYQVQDTDDPNYVYVRFEAGQGPARGWDRALNLGRVNPIDNLPVRVQKVGTEYQVLGPNGVEAALFDGGVGIGVGIGVHAHDFGPLFELVSEHRLKPGLLTPYAPDGQTYTTQCFVEAFTYVLDGVRVHVERQPTADLADRWPTSAGKRLVAVGYDTGAQALVYANGSVVGSNLTLGPSDLAAIALTGTGIVIPLDGVVLKYGTTQIDKSTTFVRHGRPLLGGLIYDPATAQFNAAQLQGRDVVATGPTDGQGLVWNASESRWEPGTVSSEGPLDNLTATTDPTTGDDSGAGYGVGSRWINTATDTAYVCLDATLGGAVWKDITANAVTVNAATAVDQALWSFEGALNTVSSPLRILNESGAARTIAKVALSVATAPTGAAVIVDVNLNGTTIYATQANRPQVADGAYAGESTAIDVATWEDGQYLTVDVDQVGSGAAGADLVVHVVYEVAAAYPALDDLSDVDAPAPDDGDVLTYDSGSGAWVPTPPEAGGAAAFTDLTDTPANYTDQGGKLVAVNAGATGLEFVAAGAGGGLTWSLELVENPSLLPGASSVMTTAQKSVITATASHNSSTAYRSVDGSTGTYWTSGAAQTSSMWVKWDFGVPVSISKMDIRFNLDYSRGFSIQASTTGDFAGEEVTLISGQVGVNGVKSVSWTAAAYRYWRFKNTASVANYVAIVDVEFTTSAPLTVAGVPYGWSVVTLDISDNELVRQKQTSESYAGCFLSDITDATQIQIEDHTGGVVYSDDAFSPTLFDLFRLKFW